MYHSIVSDQFAGMLGALGHTDNKNQLEPKKLEFFAFLDSLFFLAKWATGSSKRLEPASKRLEFKSWSKRLELKS